MPLEVSAEIRIPDAELELTFVRSSGPGGQAVNKVNSKARLRWRFATSAALPPDVRARFLERFGVRLTTLGDLILTSDQFRDRLMNERDCLERLRGMIAAVIKPPKLRKKTRPGRGARERAKVSKKKQGEKKRQRKTGSWD